MTIDRILLGHNQFIGVDHFLKREQEIRHLSLKTIKESLIF